MAEIPQPQNEKMPKKIIKDLIDAKRPKKLHEKLLPAPEKHTKTLEQVLAE